MAKATATAPLNRLLARLPADEYQRLRPHLKPARFEFNRVLHEAREPLRYAYFPSSGVLSALTVMGDGHAIEVGTVGREGMVGSTALLGVPTALHTVIVQVAGEGLRIRAGVLAELALADGPLRRLLGLYHAFFLMQVSQSVACNGLHPVHRRCCRWLLITHDRVDGNVFPLTHVFLALMLGVRRASVSDVLQPLRDRGLIAYSRGQMTVLDRTGLEAAACECFRAVNDEFARLLD